MVVGTLRLELHVAESRSLKAKRRVIKSIKDRIRSRFNASVAEVDGLDLWQRAVLGVAVVSNDRRYVNEVLSKIEDLAASDPRAALISSELSIR